MKVDKEVLLKQHFWILLGVLIPLVLVCLIVLWTATAGTIEAKQKDFQGAEKSLQGIAKPKNQKWLDDLKVRAEEVGKQKKVIWGEAWQRQKDLLTWPDLPLEDRQELDKLAFGDPISWKTKDDYGKPTGTYAEQWPPIVSIVNPVDEKGQGMVQFKGGWEAILHPFDWTKKDIKPPPDSEDLWILQEDMVVYRELLRIIKDVNELVATFHKLDNPPKPDKGKGEIDHQIFTNPTWRLDLVLAEQKNKFFRCQLTNISQRRQPLGIWFAVRIKGFDEPQFIFADGEPLPPGASFAVKDKDGNDPGPQTQSGILEGQVLEGVLQWFDWRTAPVKRIDQLGLAYHSQRTAPRGLKTLKKWEKPKEENTAQQDTGGGDSAAGGMMGHQQKMLGKMMGAMGGMGPGAGGYGGGATGEKTKNGLPKNRYVDVSDQVRRMPIAMAVVIDQEFIPDFLAVVANSKLRIQTTQVYWQRFHEDIKPKITEEEKPADGTTAKPKRTATAPRAPAGGPMGISRFGGYDPNQMMKIMQNMRGMMGGPGRMGSGPMRPGGGAMRPAGNVGTATAEASEEELDSNLVELAVHGIASLYEKYHEETAAATNP